MKLHRHRKLTDAMLERLREQAKLHARIVPYAQLAAECGIARGSVKQLMARLIKEELGNRAIVRRGADRGHLETLLADLGIA